MAIPFRRSAASGSKERRGDCGLEMRLLVKGTTQDVGPELVFRRRDAVRRPGGQQPSRGVRRLEQPLPHPKKPSWVPFREPPP